MRFASHVSDAPDLEAAVDEVTAALRAQLGPGPPDLLFAFVSPHHRGSWGALQSMVADRMDGRLFGCSGGGVIGGMTELEQRPALSLTAARLPGVTATLQHIDGRRLPPPSDAEAWRSIAAAPLGGDDTYCLALGDPFSTNANALLAGLDTVTGAGAVIGGIASGADGPGEAALFVEDEVLNEGVALLTLRGNLRIDTIVAQGCRPIGQPMFITGCDRNVILTLDGEPAAEALRGVYEGADDADKALFKRSLFVGLVMQPSQEAYGPGDFLIRNISGIDAERAGLVTGALPRRNQVVQFHLRDAATSAADLEIHLQAHKRLEETPPAGAMLFSCLGRGQVLYGRSGHDTEMIRAHLGDVPVSGFFCNGEFGRIGRRTYLHGYTSAIGLFRPLQRTC